MIHMTAEWCAEW